jgi:hypothetical protein
MSSTSASGKCVMIYLHSLINIIIMFFIQNVYMLAYHLIIYTSSFSSSSTLLALLVRKAWQNCSVLRMLCWIECWSSPSMVLLDWLYHTTYYSLYHCCCYSWWMMNDERKHDLFGSKKETECSDNNHNQIIDPSSSFLLVYILLISVCPCMMSDFILR